MATDLHPASKLIASGTAAWAGSALGFFLAAHTGLHHAAADAAGLFAGLVAAIGGVDAIAQVIDPAVRAGDRLSRQALDNQPRSAKQMSATGRKPNQLYRTEAWGRPRARAWREVWHAAPLAGHR
jgi:hypothetical protein